MFSKVLVANRGEIALRVIRALQELGVKAVAVYSEADEASLHVKAADDSVSIGPPLSSKSYLNMAAIISAAEKTGAEAVHPGYGYLAENPGFAEVCEGRGMVFIGPSAETMRLAGDKIRAKNRMAEAGVPVVPSSPGGITDVHDAVGTAAEIGYPVMVKASGGGGGRGIRICQTEQELMEEFMIAKSEAQAAFGNDEVFIEKCLVCPRHIEFQVLADHYGNVVHLNERECSVQRRYQKLIEEAPSPYLTPSLREAMGKAAVHAARVVNYRNAGTVEFLVDGGGHFYFMEINARIQVEHPVTELVSGIDLVKAQVRLAAGEKLEQVVDGTVQRGWAIECRINAEDPERGFAPAPGKIEFFQPPGGPGVRLDTHLYQGYELPVYYDSLLAKLIAYGKDRAEAIAVMRRALAEFRLEPLKTTIGLYRAVFNDPDFVAGDIHTEYIKKFVPDNNDDDDDEDEDEDED
ncbi:MAG: acetyl-CoA carboxylase biotin carboxylase subunit [Desulfobacterales bacterium]